MDMIDSSPRAEAISTLGLAPQPIELPTAVQKRFWKKGLLVCPNGGPVHAVTFVTFHDNSLRNLFVDHETMDGGEWADKRIFPVDSERHMGDMDVLYVHISYGDEEDPTVQCILPLDDMQIMLAEELVDLDELDEDLAEEDDEDEEDEDEG